MKVNKQARLICELSVLEPLVVLPMQRQTLCGAVRLLGNLPLVKLFQDRSTLNNCHETRPVSCRAENGLTDQA